jgi:hypothetical protein
MVMGEGKNLSLSQLLRLAEVSTIKKQSALRIIDEVKHAVSQWSTWAHAAGVTKASHTMIQKALNEVGVRLLLTL